MNRLFNTLGCYAFGLQSFMQEEKQIQKKIQERIDDCVKKYYEASKFPRKKKKAVRKKLNAEYSFHKQMKEWESEFSFL